ncbi:NAD(P)/FAD-dependent oxidoreductase [Streptomyces sp. NPDC102270]|uniref:NAD(P)/FAD-dependent oxidoreductase n=1 Tax=Streptomyces sp. NPDC102270 TaxID=3366150 RepID=UPI00382D7201
MLDRPSCDVVVLGGGLAGLTLAIQLKNARPQTDVVVLDKRRGLAPEAAFKVGESTVPTGAHYFAEIVGMKEHLDKFHLQKNGLRFFQPAGDNSDLTRRIELGSLDFPVHVNYQIDRGRFENELTRTAIDLGVDLRQGCDVSGVTLRPETGHEVSFAQDGAERTLRSRWLVDAAGRAGVIKRHLGIGREVAHTIDASWFRLAGGIDLEQWGADNPEWLSRMRRTGIRQFSTNHLMGDGYWVWLIPLGSDHVSVGICTDPRLHPYEEISDFDRVLDWLHRHEPQLARAMAGRTGDVADFLTVRDFAFGVQRVYSPDRWALVGEAGAFADAFYSPGSDMIAYGNTATTDLVVRDLDGQDVTEPLEFYNDFHLKTFAFVLSKVEDHYPSFGNPVVMVPKLSWDRALNHFGVVLLFVQNRFEYAFLRSVRADIDKLYLLNERVQQLFRDWNRLERGAAPGPAPAHAVAKAVRDSATELVVEHSDEELRAAVARNVEVAEAMAVGLFHRAARNLAEHPAPDVPVNPYAIGLNPGDWRADGLFDGEVLLTLAQADEIAEGLRGLFADPLLTDAA